MANLDKAARMRALEGMDMGEEEAPEADFVPPEGGEGDMGAEQALGQIAMVLEQVVPALPPDQQNLVAQALDLLRQASGGATPEGPVTPEVPEAEGELPPM